MAMFPAQLRMMAGRSFVVDHDVVVKLAANQRELPAERHRAGGILAIEGDQHAPGPSSANRLP